MQGYLDRRRLLAASVLAPFGLTAAARAAEPKVFTIPFLMPRDKAYMLVGINGQGPFRFAIDTGNAGATAINFKLVQSLKLPDYDSRRTVGVVGEAKEHGLYAAEEMNFGGAFKQRHVALGGLGDGETDALGLDGLTPAAFFLQGQVEMDFERQELRVFADGTPDRTGFAPLPFIAQNHDQIVVDAKLGDISCRFQVDTGAPGALGLSPRFVARNNLWDAFPKHLASGARGVTGGADARVVKAESLTVGPYKFRNPIVKMIDPAARSGMEHDGLIGLDLLRRFTLSFDGPGHTLWIKPNRFISEPFQYDRTGVRVWYYPDRKEAFVIKLEADGSGAKSGLLVGDRLPEIHSIREAADLQWRLYAALTGDVLDLKIERGGQPQTVKIAVEDRL